MRPVPLLAAFLLLASGCTAGPDRSPTPSGPPPADSCAGISGSDPPRETSTFQGENAWFHAAELVCDLGASPARERYRVPGTPERDAGAARLRDRLAAAGWDARFENFTGAQYEGLEKKSLATFLEPPYCSADELTRMRGLTFRNVVATRGAGNATLLLMAHYDSKRFASQDADSDNRTRPVLGANDGASGVGVLLELARVLGATPFHVQVRILLVDGEDGYEDCHPDAGSLWHAEHLADWGPPPAAGVLLLDMVGDLDAKYCIAGNNATLAERLQAHARDLDVPGIAEAPRCFVYDDHTPFVDRGHPSADIIDFRRSTSSGFPPYWHTRQDTMDKLSPLMMGDVGRVAEAFVRERAV